MNTDAIRFISRLSAGAKRLHELQDKARWSVFAVVFLLALLPVFLHVPLTGLATCFWSFIEVGTVLYLCGRPYRAAMYEKALQEAGITDHNGNPPAFVCMDRNGSACIFTFYTAGIPPARWQEKRPAVESALNIHAGVIESGKDQRNVVIRGTDGAFRFPDIISWNNGFIPLDESEIALGEGYGQKIDFDFDVYPHMLIGGATGSGKSILLKCILHQAIQKGYRVIIADFKGGVDYGPEFRGNAEFIDNEDTLIDSLENIVNEILPQRKALWNQYEVKKLEEYNQRNQESPLPRILIACDELGELLDTTGASKEQKDKISRITACLSTVARQGRAFGINLVLATQRPDSNLVPGQIKSNITYRICGRADDVLSRLILDNTSASDLIPPNSKGLFLDSEGNAIKGYYFTD